MGEPDGRSDAPWEVLGLPPGADGDAIRAAYLEQVKRHPPDRAPDEFERIRDAYEQLRDPRRRAEALLLGADPNEPLVSLLAGFEAPRRFVGPEPWRAVLMEK